VILNWTIAASFKAVGLTVGASSIREDGAAAVARCSNCLCTDSTTASGKTRREHELAMVDAIHCPEIDVYLGVNVVL